MSDLVVRSLKKGKSPEQSAAAALGVLLCLQLGLGSESDEIYKEVQPIFVVLLTDKACNPSTRQKVGVMYQLSQMKNPSTAW